MKRKPIPEVGKLYHFFDDGKTSSGRHYIVRVEKVIPISKSVETLVPKFDYDLGELVLKSLWDIWRSKVIEHNWLYSTKTDYLVEASCPNYDKNNLWFARTIDGGWFSMNIQSSWQSGRLDIDGTIFNNIIQDAKKYGMDISEYTSETYEQNSR